MDYSKNSSEPLCSQSTTYNDSAATDDHLMIAIQNGDSKAFKTLQNRYYERLFSFVIRSIKSHEETEDVLQEVFYRVYKYRAQYKSIASFSTWIHTIARNLIRSHFRKYPNKDMSFSAGSDFSGFDNSKILDTALLQDQLLEQEEVNRMLNETLLSLRPEFRTALVLRDYLHFSYEEIALKTEVPVGTVKSRINRGRAIMREFLQKKVNQKESRVSRAESSRVFAK